jgi:hypothetical protein
VNRTLIIGDVHGCAVELADLLDRLAVTSGDELCFVGDLVARGPDTRGVLRIARETKARVVLGNHEERLLEARRAREKDAPLPKLGGTHKRLLEELDETEWAQLEALPLKVDLEARGLRIVHAGLVPGVPFEQQDPWLVTHIRSISDDGVPSKHWGTPWAARYEGPPHVVFGHNARRDPQLHRDATGIDTACVYGGALTAFVLPHGAEIPPPEARRDVLVSVPARRAYVDYGQPLPTD